MLRRAAKWGIILAVVLAAWTLSVHALGIYTVRLQYADLVDRLALIVPLGVLTLAILEERRAHGGHLAFGRGLVTGTLAALVSAPLSTLFMYFYHHVLNPQWLGRLTDHAFQTLSARGVPPDSIALTIRQLQRSGTDGQQIVGGLLGTVLIGVVLSIVISGTVFLADARRRRRAVSTR